MYIYHLIPDITTVAKMHPGTVVDVRSPHMHLELSYGDVVSDLSCTAAILPSRPELSMHIIWQTGSNTTELIRDGCLVEFKSPWSQMGLPDGYLFMEPGIVFRVKDDLIAIKASLYG